MVRLLILSYMQLNAECDGLRRNLRDAEKEFESQRVMLRREARTQMQEASKAKHALSDAHTKVI